MQKVRQSGFTLVELMIVVAIIGILAAVAYPAYTRHVVKSRRTDAQRLLLDYAANMERFYSVNGTYKNGANCGVSAPSASYYTVACAADATSPASYTVTATPVATLSQSSDGTLTLNNTGTKGGSVNSGNWAN
ncbi:type IV pilin protein [Leeia sp.]|uniref:type IV pilin protein n=1 Tax=Leeia sp. TaxID=2884678 RepID=UPI0035B4F92D